MAEFKSSSYITPHLKKTLIGLTARELSEVIIFPPETSALSALVAASHAIGTVFSVAYRDGGILPIQLYGLSEQPAGSGKSPLIRRLYDGYTFEAVKINKEIAKLKKDATTNITMRVKKGEIVSENEEAAANNYSLLPTNVSDTTPQGLEGKAAMSDGCFIALSTEQNLTDTLLGGLYSDGKAVPGLINSAFNAEHFESARANDKRVTFSGYPFGGVFCLSQAGTISSVLNSANGSGMAERFLMLKEDKINKSEYSPLKHLTNEQISEIIVSNDESAYDELIGGTVRKKVETPYTDQFATMMRRMATMRRQMNESHSMEFHNLTRLKISEFGWLKIHAEQLRYHRMSENTPNSFKSSLFQKIDMQIMRIAATIHVSDASMNGAIPNVISSEAVTIACKIAESLFEGVDSLAGDNATYGDEVEDDFIVDYITKHRDQTNEQLKRNVKRVTKDNPFSYYRERGEAQAKIQQSVDRLVIKGSVIILNNRKEVTYRAL